MKIKTWFALGCLALSVATTQAQSISPSTKWHWQEGTIIVDTPARPAGQQSALGLTAPKMKCVRVGFVGLGMRGPGAVLRFCNIPGVEVVALCDYEENRAEACQKYMKDMGLAPAAIYSGEKGYEQLCLRSDIDLVYIATDWDHHFPVAKFAMEHGKHTAIEVPSAMNLEQCWALINLSEQTRLHCMILENCCYDYYEMNALNMAQHGVFGEIVAAEGAYIHNLDPFWDAYWQNPETDKDGLHWRMKYNMENRGDVYATHGLGPVAQCLDIHRGDRFTTLVAMDTKSVHGKEWAEKKLGKPVKEYRNGDQTTTLMRTAQGKMVQIQHNTMTPQPYNRLFKLIGEKGYATKYPVEHFSLTGDAVKSTGMATKMDDLSGHSFISKEAQDELVKKYYHPILTKYGELGREMGHGGMDFVMDSRLVYCLQNGLPLDMDVYDLAEWCCLAELGTLSMDHNCASVAFPDFTRGEWQKQKGYRHAYASPEDEAQQEADAKAVTAKQKEAVKACNLWALYDAQKGGDAKAVKTYQKAVLKYKKMMAK